MNSKDRFLSQERIHQLHAAAISANLSVSAILRELGPALRASLPWEISPSAQLLSALSELNRIRLSDGSVPLATVLRTAAALARPRAEEAVFIEALNLLGGAELGRALPKADDDEILVVVAQFDNATPERIHVEERIHRALSRAKEVMPALPLRIERLRDVTIKDGDDARAVQVVTECNARLLIWGWYDSIGFISRLTADPAAMIETSIPPFDEVLRDASDTSFRRYIFSGLADDLRTWALVVVGELLYWTGLFEDAWKAFEFAIDEWTLAHAGGDTQLDARIASGLFYNGVIAGTRKGDVRTAAACFRQVLELKPKAYIAAYNLGDALYNLQDYAGAISAFGTALELAGPHHPSLVGRGHAYYKLGDYRKAVEHYTAALGLMTSADVLLARSRAHQASGQPRLALGDYSLARDVDPLAAMPSDYLDKRLFRTYGKHGWEAAEFAPFGDPSSRERPNVTHFLATARRFLGRTAPPLGTRGVVADPAAETIADALTGLHYNTGFFMERLGEPVDHLIEETGRALLRAFDEGLQDQDDVLDNVVILLRLRRGCLSGLFRLPDVWSRLHPRLRAALEVVLALDVAYLNAAVIVGCGPVRWTGDEAGRAPECEALADRLRALEEAAREDREWETTRRREGVIGDLMSGLAPPERITDSALERHLDDVRDSPDRAESDVADNNASIRVESDLHHRRVWRWPHLLAIGRGVSTVRNDPALSKRVGELLRFLGNEGLIPADIMRPITEIFEGACPFLLEAVDLHCHDLGRRVKASELSDLKGIANALVRLRWMNIDEKVHESSRAAARVVLEKLTEDSYWIDLNGVEQACELLKSDPATASLFKTLSAFDVIRARLRLPESRFIDETTHEAAAQPEIVPDGASRRG